MDIVFSGNIRNIFFGWNIFLSAEDRYKAAPGKRFPHLVPVRTPGGKPVPPAFMRPTYAQHGAPVQNTAPAFSLPAQKIKLKLGTSAVSKPSGGGPQK